MTDIVERLPLVCEAITEEYGEECAMFDPECWTCKVWAELRLSLSEARATGRREGMEWSARYHDDLAAQHAAAHAHVESDHHMMMEMTNRRHAAAIRAAMEKAACDPPVGNKDIGERHGDHH